MSEEIKCIWCYRARLVVTKISGGQSGHLECADGCGYKSRMHEDTFYSMFDQNLHDYYDNQ